MATPYRLRHHAGVQAAGFNSVLAVKGVFGFAAVVAIVGIFVWRRG